MGTHPVGKKLPNAWGLYDMGGNVYEWCNDFFALSLGTSSAIDPWGPASGNTRVLRSASWSYGAKFLRAASRGQVQATAQYNNIGFRCFRTN
jgi:formylglycine-generating enzyme required for sulfatase activity